MDDIVTENETTTKNDDGCAPLRTVKQGTQEEKAKEQQQQQQ